MRIELSPAVYAVCISVFYYKKRQQYGAMVGTMIDHRFHWSEQERGFNASLYGRTIVLR